MLLHSEASKMHVYYTDGLKWIKITSRVAAFQGKKNPWASIQEVVELVLTASNQSNNFEYVVLI